MARTTTSIWWFCVQEFGIVCVAVALYLVRDKIGVVWWTAVLLLATYQIGSALMFVLGLGRRNEKRRDRGSRISGGH